MSLSSGHSGSLIALFLTFDGEVELVARKRSPPEVGSVTFT